MANPVTHLSIHRGFTVLHLQRFHVDSLSQVALPCICCSGHLGLIVPSLYDCFPFSIWVSECILSPRLLPDHFAVLLNLLWLKTLKLWLRFPFNVCALLPLWEHKIYRNSIMIILFLDQSRKNLGKCWISFQTWQIEFSLLKSIWWKKKSHCYQLTSNLHMDASSPPNTHRHMCRVYKHNHAYA